MESRSKNSIRNIQAGLVFKLTNLVFKFIMRTVFIYCLGQKYVGINGVFSNIISVLSLTELGIGTAIVYDLYKPIANKDEYKVTQLFLFYKRVYNIIGLLIFVVGMCLVPFLDKIITDVEGVRQLTLIYVLTLASTVSSYFFAQYTSVIEAYQKQSVVSTYNIIASVIKTIIEIIVLIQYRSYILYLIIEIIVNVATNGMIAQKAMQLFPYLKKKVFPLSKKEITGIMKNAMSVFSLNVASTVVNATDNILISSMISTLIAGSYSTYLLIIMSVQQVVYTLKTSVLASVGNLCANGEYEKKREVFWNLSFAIYGVNTIVSACFLTLLTPFIMLWAGESYVLSQLVVLFLVINYFLRGLQWPVEVFYNAEGLYKYFRFKPWIQVALNIIFSVILGLKIGILGIVMGTTLSEICTTFWYDIYITNKYSLKGKLTDYWKKTIVNILLSWTAILISCVVSSRISGEGIWGLFIKGGVTSILAGILFIIFHLNTVEMRYMFNLLKNSVRRK